MKTILVATDFSKNAQHAAQFALQLAQQWNAELVLMNAYHLWPDNPIKAGDFPLSINQMREDSQKALRQLATKLQAKGGVTVPIRCVAQEGHTRAAIQAVARHEKADLLVMSTIGTAPQAAQIMGSVATDMIAETNVPMLLIPPTAEYGGIDNIVLGVDLSSPPNAVALDTALRFARAFQAVINILCVDKKPESAATVERAEHIRRLTVAQPHTLTIVGGGEVYDALLTFARTNKADLIMMLPQEHHWLRQLFLEGETQHVARLSEIPLLAVV